MSNKTRSLIGSIQAELDRRQGLALRKDEIYVVASKLLQSFDTPIALGVYLRLKYGEEKQAVTMGIDPSDYLTADHFRLDYQAVSLLKKTPLKIEGLEPRKTGLESFYKAEEICAATNRRIKDFRTNPGKYPSHFHSIFHRASGFIDRILREIDCAAVLWEASFGPGSDSSTSEGHVTSYDKLSVRPECSADSLPLVCAAINETYGLRVAFGRDPAYGPQQPFTEADVRVVNSNKITFVPKSAKTDRVIAIEPHMNIYLQLGVGRLIRQRLRQGLTLRVNGESVRLRLNLDTQLNNQKAALRGSLDNALCTVDMSMASDTVAREIVRELLPHDWFVLLDSLRSKSGSLRVSRHEKHVVVYEKFSSMGNGFTFELETLIFWALALACAEYDSIDPIDAGFNQLILAYGDDVVIPKEVWSTFNEILAFAGFVPNADKTFVSGPFRESCGKDYFYGTEVRPFFLKEIPRGPQAIFRLANGIRRAAHRSFGGWGCDSRYYRAWSHCLRWLPNVFRKLVVPPQLDNAEGWDDSAGLIGNVDEYLAAVPAAVWNEALQKAEFHSYGLIAQPRRFSYRITDRSRAVKLYDARNGLLREASYDKVWLKAILSQRTSEVTYKVRRLTFELNRWKELGPWL